MSLAIIDNWNNRIVSSQPVEDSQNSLILPPPDTCIWHYIRFDFFQALLKNKALCLTRLDKQSDKNDGMYSDANAHEWTPVIKKLMEHSGMNIQIGKEEWPQLQLTNQILRERTFIHCWSIRAKESAWMWNAFVGGEPRSIALRCTVGCLIEALKGQPVDFARILYYSSGEARPDWSYTAPFTAKDKNAHVNERELRVMTMVNSRTSENTKHCLIPIVLKKMIRKVVVHPACPPSFRLEVRSELAAHEIHTPVALSQFQQCDLKAVA